MKAQQEFTVTINTSPEKVWKVLWDDKIYSLWTAIFSQGSYAKTDWKEGSKVLFLTPDGRGMVSKIKQKMPNKYMLFEHLGVVKNNIENLESKEAKEWAGATETYMLESVDSGKTHLTVKMDVVEEYKNFFLDTWPKAMDKIKELAEKKN
ncbi:activator of Hsp90 ATPase-like protein [Tenacibaculum gallaicum]|uniref:Activator of Hsp90 ATPase-like protein n=1 Tax=Tenacibaculum gallaicum TaxID=561505 RepID=A0A3E0I7T5_9FLAO|nr:SRPBCC domain-containing protein [Tenacibaculum gallaicum]REH54697.1 activator of Hsp90 ATPase-like protein [Tenacibaculum gallaicum]